MNDSAMEKLVDAATDNIMATVDAYDNGAVTRGDVRALVRQQMFDVADGAAIFAVSEGDDGDEDEYEVEFLPDDDVLDEEENDDA